MDKIDKAIEIFRKLPSIGPRQARRIVLSLLNNKSVAQNLSAEVGNLNNEVSKCQTCHKFFAKNHSEVCRICGDENRDRDLLMITEHDSDLDAVEKSGVYHGLYFILDGVIPVLSKEPEKLINFSSLSKRIKEKKPKEIILALSATPEGDNTVDYILEKLGEEFKKNNIKVSVLGRGLSTGTELEYADPETLRGALKNRH